MEGTWVPGWPYEADHPANWEHSPWTVTWERHQLYLTYPHKCHGDAWGVKEKSDITWRPGLSTICQERQRHQQLLAYKHTCTHMHSSCTFAAQFSLSQSPLKQQSAKATVFLASHQDLIKGELLHPPSSLQGRLSASFLLYILFLFL